MYMKDKGMPVDKHDKFLVALKNQNKIRKGAEAGEEMIFASGSSIVSLSAQKGRGRTADRNILDEMGFYTTRDAKTTLPRVMKSIAPTLERSGGQMVGITTANGRGPFYRMWTDAINKKTKYYPFFVGCWDDPDYTEEKRQDIIVEHGLDHCLQEYPRTWKEAFLASGRPRFDGKAVDYYEKERTSGYRFRGDMMDDTEEITANVKGNFKVIRKYELHGQYIVVCDVAEGLEKGDWSVAKVFCMITWFQVAEWHGHIEHALFGSVAVKICRMFNNALLIIETGVSAHGTSAMTQARNVENYPERFIFEHNIVKKIHPDDDFKQPFPRFGWRTTAVTRPLIINTLAKALLKKTIPNLLKEDVEEISTFIIKNNGKAEAEDGCFDDRVMVLAIAFYLLNNDTFQSFYPVVDRKDHQMCRICQNYKVIHRDDTAGKCLLSQRECDAQSFCTAWKQWMPEDDTDLFIDETYSKYMKS